MESPKEKELCRNCRNNLKLDRLNDSELVDLVRTCCSEAYREVIKRYEKKLFAYLYHLLRNKEEVEDVLQNVFAKVFEHLDSFDMEKKFSSWIYRIAHNEGVNYIKKRSRKRLVSWEDIASTKDKLESSSNMQSPIDDWIRKESRREVRSALDKLPSKYREILTLRYYKEESYEEMSQELKKPVNTVGTLLSRAKKKLQRIIENSRGGSDA